MSRPIQQRLKNRLARASGFQRLLGRFGGAGERSLWIFILGCYNSGTTLLYEILRSNDRVASLPWEGSRLTHLLADPADFGWPWMWQKCLPELQALEAGLDADAATRIRRQWQWSSSGPGPVFVEKSITNAIRIPFLARYFQPAFFIHIVRDGYAVSEGIRRKGVPSQATNPDGLERYPIELCIDQWVAANQFIERDLANHDHVRIRYEDLCSDCLGTLQRISDACPMISQQGVTLQAPQAPTVHGESNVIANQNEVAIERLDARDIRIISERARDTLQHYRYPVLD